MTCDSRLLIDNQPMAKVPMIEDSDCVSNQTARAVLKPMFPMASRIQLVGVHQLLKFQKRPMGKRKILRTHNRRDKSKKTRVSDAAACNCMPALPK